MSETLEVAKEQYEDLDYVEHYGVTARIVPVPIGLLQDALSRLKEPKVPTFFDEDKQESYENPTDPEYLRAIEEHKEKISKVTTEVFCMFGIELDGMPETDEWLKRIQFLVKRGTIVLDDIDLQDEMDREFLFKRYIVGSTAVIRAISEKTSVTQAGVNKAKEFFRR